MLTLNKLVSPSFIFIHICCILNTAFTFTQNPPPHTLLVTRLTHFHSIRSPFFDPTKTTKDLADIDLHTSISRALHLTTNKTSLFNPTGIETQLVPRQQNGFLARLGVGSHEVEQLVYMDTGSNLLWINCEPCGYNVPGPIFHPKESLSYEVEDCLNSNICDSPGLVQIDPDTCDDTCPYGVSYGGGGYSRGHLARETFKFGKSVKNMVFGCARTTNLNVNGVLGLGKNRLSLVSQTRSWMFSYCIGNISDKSYAYNTLVIGNKIELLGSQTPLSTVEEDRYYVTLESISIGEKVLDHSGRMLVDTGSTLGFIPLSVLKKLETEVSDVIGFTLSRNSSILYNGYTRLCYNGAVYRDLNGFPSVELEFKGEATMELSAGNMFQQIYEESFCLAFLPSEILGSAASILGNLMQQYFYVAYDLRGMKLGFQRMECNMVDDYINDELVIGKTSKS